MKYLIGMDVGGTAARLKIADLSMQPVGEWQDAGITAYTLANEDRNARYRALILSALEECGLARKDCAGLCVGASGVDSPQLKREFREMFVQMGFSPGVVSVYNDCELLLYSGKGPKLVIVAGTGSIVYGTDGSDSVYRYGGWGHLISDEGSGFWLAKEALSAAARAMDGAAEGQTLAAMVRKKGLASPEEIAAFYRDNIFNKGEIARYAVVVEPAAEQGDAEALRIERQGALALYAGARTVAGKVRRDTSGLPLQVLLWGSVLMHYQAFSQQVTALLQNGLAPVEISHPALSTLDTALRIAKQTADGRKSS
ncbi:MAG: N-acetylglucosamine kinase [Acetanaerobacterium sp.]